MKTLLTTAAAVTTMFLTSCGTRMPANENQPVIHKGMTMQQVRAACGEPQMRRSGAPGFAQILGGGDADTIWTYHNGAANLIPMVGLLRGGRTDSTTVYFKNGNVIQVSQESSGLW